MVFWLFCPGSPGGRGRLVALLAPVLVVAIVVVFMVFRRVVLNVMVVEKRMTFWGSTLA